VRRVRSAGWTGRLVRGGPFWPRRVRDDARVFSSRVAEYSIDQAFVMPALDRIALHETGG
jgi:hypothetical protein